MTEASKVQNSNRVSIYSDQTKSKGSNSNPFINSVFSSNEGAAKGKTAAFHDTVQPQASGSLWCMG